MSDYIIWLLLFFVFFIIIGLYISEFTPLDLSEKERILKLSYLTENFTPKISSSTAQSEGASELYDWGLPDNNVYNIHKKCEHKCDNKCQPECPRKCILPPIPVETCTEPSKNISTNEVCSKCDITSNKDIDKYVLKSSVPACPDMSEFITKNMMNANPDLSDYILKSEIKACEKIDTSQYILKNQIPACPTCPVCPECPICPVCPDPVPCKKIFEYSISEHPDINKYISRDELNKNYIAKDSVLQSDLVKDFMNKNCNNNHIPPPVPLAPLAPQQPQQPQQLKQSQKQKQNTQPYISSLDNIFEENNSKSELLGNVYGYYAGDSLFAGF